jgi:uncharacterized protein (DUF1330 family)
MAAERWTRLVGLDVVDQDTYRRYRAQMTPILERFGGRFGYDFRIADVLRSEIPQPINRVFTVVFPSRAAMRRFFDDPDYLRVRAAYFEPSVRHQITIAEF